MRAISILLPLAAAWGQVAREANRDYQTQESRAKVVERLRFVQLFPGHHTAGTLARNGAGG